MVEEDEDESPHVNVVETDEEAQDTCLALDNDLDSDVDDITIEEGAKNSKPKDFHDIVPTSLHAYADVFSKTAFDSLPEHCKWDHAIELEHKPSPGFCKVYLSTLTEQMEMDTFLEEVLATGHIRQSKSTLGAPVFFIKKKDRKLRFIQDYRVLNAITRKNRYLLPLINDLIHWLKSACYFTKLDMHWGYNNVCT
jgi:hypothetical protein